MSSCFGIKIILQDKDNPVSENGNIGLYNVSGDNSEFRWCQNEIAGLSTTWKYGMIVAGGIERFSVEINLYNGGNTSVPGKGAVKINNLNKFWETVEALEINFRGLKCEIWILGTGDYQERLRTYFCKEPTWNNTIYEISFEGQQKVRVANIMQVITEKDYQNASSDTIGNSVPVSFGKLLPLQGNENKLLRSTMAKFIRTDDAIVEKFFTDAYLTGSNFTNTFIFPFEEEVSPSANLHREFKFWYRNDTVSSIYSIYPEDTYMKVVDGGGSGQVRKVERIYITTNGSFNVTITDFLNEDLNNTDDRSWIQLVKIHRKYSSDHFPCKSFIDSNDNDLVNAAEIYTYTEEDSLQRIAPYGYDFIGVNNANNSVKIDPKFFDNGNIDTQNSYLILPVQNFCVPTVQYLTEWTNEEEPNSWATSEKIQDALYTYATSSGADSYSKISVNNNFEYITDKDSTTYAEQEVDGQENAGGDGHHVIYYFDLPELPSGFTFSKCYIGIKANVEFDENEEAPEENFIHNFRIMLRRFKYGVLKIILEEANFSNAVMYPGGVNLDDTPDFYYNNAPDTGNKHFFKIVDDDNQQYYGLGNAIFDTGITDIDIYNSYIKGCIVLTSHYTVASNPILFEETLQYYQLCMIFEKSSDISKNIYIPLHGRVFAHTWQGRKTATDLIDKPYDALEHVCRLQNYQDTCTPPVSGWGMQYADEPQIATDKWGSFDDPDLAASRNYEIACQIVDYAKGYTDKVKQTICNDFVLANWQDNDGFERVIALPEYKLDPVYTIQLSDILDRRKIKINEREDSNIIAEPWVSYNKNPATGEYEDIIKITNAYAGSYSTNYVSGIENADDAEELWNACHSLALKTHTINKPSTDQTDLQWANGPGAYTVALRYLQNWVNWQFTNEIEVPIHFNLASSWQQCTPVNLLFSHQTNNISRSALIERITVNPQGYETMIKAIMYA